MLTQNVRNIDKSTNTNVLLHVNVFHTHEMYAMQSKDI